MPSGGPPDWLGLGRGQRVDVRIDLWLATTRTDAREGSLTKHHVRSDEHLARRLDSDDVGDFVLGPPEVDSLGRALSQLCHWVV